MTPLQQHIMGRLALGAADWTPLPGGSVNDAWRVTVPDGRVVVVRIGPDPDSAGLVPSWLRVNGLACEQHILALARPHLRLVPATVAAGFLPGQRPWVAQELVPGEPLAEVLPGMLVTSRAAVWRDVGAMVKRIHAIDAPWFGTPDGCQRFPDWPGMVMHDIAGLRDDARRMGLARAPFEALARLAHHHVRDLAMVVAPRVVHCDLTPRHILGDRNGHDWRITGIVDWEYGRYGDPDSEGLLLEMLDLPADDNRDTVAFLDGYGPVDRAADANARRAIYRGIALGWELTDAVRCDDSDRVERATSAFSAWAARL